MKGYLRRIKFEFCPHCGRVNIHDVSYMAYLCDQRTKLHICWYCNWVWCKMWGTWYMARHTAELEDPGGIEFEAEKYLKGRLERAKN